MYANTPEKKKQLYIHKLIYESMQCIKKKKSTQHRLMSTVEQLCIITDITFPVQGNSLQIMLPWLLLERFITQCTTKWRNTRWSILIKLQIRKLSWLNWKGSVIQNGCGCRRGLKSAQCSDQFTEENVLYSCLELSQVELDLVILALLTIAEDVKTSWATTQMKMLFCFLFLLETETTLKFMASETANCFRFLLNWDWNRLNNRRTSHIVSHHKDREILRRKQLFSRSFRITCEQKELTSTCNEKFTNTKNAHCL